ncbi:unnamed protein product [Cochlearia groenlandica]
MQTAAENVSAASAAIASDPNFAAALAAAITSIINGSSHQNTNNNNNNNVATSNEANCDAEERSVEKTPVKFMLKMPYMLIDFKKKTSDFIIL